MRKRYWTIIFLFTALCGCLPQDFTSTPQPGQTQMSPKSPTPEDKEQEYLVILLGRSGGFAGVNESWLIFSNGRIELPDGSELEVEVDQVNELIGKIEALGFFEIDIPKLGISACRDCFQYQLTVHYDNQKKTISWEDDQSVPQELWTIFEEIQLLIVQNDRP